MSPRSVRRGLYDRIDRSWAIAILFSNTWNFALPVAESGLPSWSKPFQIVHGVFISEVLVLAYLLFVFFTRVGYVPLPRGRGWHMTLVIAALGFIGAISSLVNARPLKEFGTAGRYFLLATFFAFAVYWARRYGPTFVLRAYLLGILASGILNLYYTFTLHPLFVGGLPMLLGQNGPGGHLGMATLLSAWLMIERRERKDVVLAVAMFVVGFVGVSISYSKLAMLMAAAGATAWLFVLLHDFSTPRTWRWYGAIFTLLFALAVVKYETLLRYANGVLTFVDYKFGTVDPQSIGVRAQYFLVTGEILLRHPIWGVGYGGFYDAAVVTEAYKTGRAGVEDPEAGARGESNPHSSFLNYAAFNGIVGLAAALAALLLGFQTLLHVLWKRRMPGKALWFCFVFGYLIFGLTLPTLFNTSILYIPVAIAFGMLEHPQWHALPRPAGMRLARNAFARWQPAP